MSDSPNEHNSEQTNPKIVDIFSKSDRQPRLFNDNPLDPQVQAQPDADTAIVGEKTAATMQAELMIDDSDSADAVTQAQEDKIVTLAPEYDADTQFAGEVLDKLDTFQDPSEIRTFHTIDIRLEEKKEPEPPEPPEAPQEDKQAARVVAKVPVYRPDEPANLLNVKAGKFSEVVGREYEAYLRSSDPVISAHTRRPSPQAAQPAAPPVPQESTQEKILGAVVGFFSKEETPKEAPQKEKPKPVEDYTSEEDEKSIRFELSESMRKLFFRTVISGVIALVAIAISVVTRILPEALIAAIPVAPAAYAVFNFLLVGSSMVLNRVSVTGGLTPLVKLKGNSDTAVAVASCAALIQTIVAFFVTLGDMSHFSVHYYCSIVLLAFFANNLGKLYLVRRVRENFSFLTAKGQKYAAKIYNNESVAHKMLSGTLSENNLIAYQHKTKFAANFLKISYAPDPSEDLASRLAPVTTIAALAVTLLYGVLKGSAADAVNTLSLLTALSVPIATLLAVNVPVRKLCRTVNGYGAMIAGFPSIKQFCDSTAIMIDAEELFPADSIELEGIKTFVEYQVDESLLCGIAILKEAHNPIANAFEAVVSETKQTLPEVESVLYEDGLGLVGWVNSERILVGSRKLLEKYQVRIPSRTDEETYQSEGKQVTYISRAGGTVAMLVTAYSADAELQSELQRAEKNGISFLIRTTDYNITDELVAKLYNLFYRSLKVLPTGLGNALLEAQSVTEEKSRSYLITHGKTAGLARAVSGCVRIKQNISMAVIIQLIAIILGLLLSVPIVLYAGVSVMGTLEVGVYALFWTLAAVIAPALQKP